MKWISIAGERNKRHNKGEKCMKIAGDSYLIERMGKCNKNTRRREGKRGKMAVTLRLPHYFVRQLNRKLSESQLLYRLYASYTA